MLNEEKREQKRTYVTNLRAQRRDNGLCTVCGNPSRVGKLLCHDCFTSTMDKRDQRKGRAVEYLGGKCADCGYQTEFLTVYDFHHKEERAAKKEISYLITANVSWDKMQKELDKCILLCANCHRIRHEKEHKDTP